MFCMISGFRRDADVNCAVLGYNNPEKRSSQKLCSLNWGGLVGPRARLEFSEKIFFFSCFVDRASLYNPFQMKPIRCTLLLSIFISNYLHVSGNYVNNNNNNNNIYLLQLGCNPVAVVMLHVYKT